MLESSPCTAESIEAARRAAVLELRDAAGVIATEKGHQLGTWRSAGYTEIETAHCAKCWRVAVIEVDRDPHLAGPALSERCAPRRPDAFLANQYESKVR